MLVLLLLVTGVALPLWWSPYSAAGRIALAIEERDATALQQTVSIERLRRAIAADVRANQSGQRAPAAAAFARIDAQPDRLARDWRRVP